jgi:hypothetical protein
MATVEKAATDTAAAAEALSTAALFTATDTARATDSFTLDTTGGVYTTGQYPFTATPLQPTHTWGEVLSYEDVHGTQGQ